MNRRSVFLQLAAGYMTLDDAPDVLTVPEAAQLMRLSASALYKSIRSGHFPGTKVRGRVVVLKSVLIAFLGGA
jgi:excisionase family DNA binding protein